jgi:hypothetical protein
MKRAIYTAVLVIVLFGAWELYLRNIDRPNIEMINVFERSVDRVERMFLNETHDYDVILTGSSSTARFDISAYGEKTYNLSMEGGASLTGLYYLKDMSIYPKVLLVEINSIERLEDERIEKMFSNPVKNFLRKNFLSFRIENRPGYFMNHLFNVTFDYLNYHFISADVYGSNAVNPELIENVAKKNEDDNKEVDKAVVKRQIEKLDKVLADFKSHGTEVILMALPYSKNINNAAGVQFIHSAFEAFSDGKYKLVSFDKTKEYQTTDGVHLVESEIDKYLLNIEGLIDPVK